MKQNNIPLELDARIFDIADIRTVITAGENDVGKMGYFANSIHLFKNLNGTDGIKYGKLMYLSNLDYGGDMSDKCFVCDNHWTYRYFIPEDALKPIEKKKKYRPYTLEEFKQRFNVGWVIRFRGKHSGTDYLLVFNGYVEYHDGASPVIILGNHGYPLKELFEDYEWVDSESEGYIPFGIKE